MRRFEVSLVFRERAVRLTTPINVQVVWFRPTPDAAADSILLFIREMKAKRWRAVFITVAGTIFQLNEHQVELGGVGDKNASSLYRDELQLLLGIPTLMRTMSVNIWRQINNFLRQHLEINTLAWYQHTFGDGTNGKFFLRKSACCQTLHWRLGAVLRFLHCYCCSFRPVVHCFIPPLVSW